MCSYQTEKVGLLKNITNENNSQKRQTLGHAYAHSQYALAWAWACA